MYFEIEEWKTNKIKFEKKFNQKNLFSKKSG
jgi:hypothetical protein